MSDQTTANKRGGKRKQPFTEREARRLLRAGKAEGGNCTLRKLPDGTLELTVSAPTEHGRKNPLDRVLSDAAHEDGTA